MESPLFESGAGYVDPREIEELLQEGMIRDIHRDRLIWVDEPNRKIVDEFIQEMLKPRGRQFHRIIVYAFHDYYFIINGNHRAAALCQLDFTLIPCMVIKTEEDFQFLLQGNLPIEHLRKYRSLEDLHQSLARKMIGENLRGHQLFKTPKPVDVERCAGIYERQRR